MAYIDLLASSLFGADIDSDHVGRLFSTLSVEDAEKGAEALERLITRAADLIRFAADDLDGAPFESVDGEALERLGAQLEGAVAMLCLTAARTDMLLQFIASNRPAMPIARQPIAA